MSVREKPCSQDDRIHEVFGASVTELYGTVTGSGATAAVPRALKLRSFLALAEEQVARMRERVHHAMAPEHDMDELSADDLRWDAQWLGAALEARDGYSTALDDLLRSMPPPGQPDRPVRTTQPTLTTTLPRPSPPRYRNVPGRPGPADRESP
ncbi:hypothetical protein ACIF80_36110 [Streptomyces sp. NPDC085927]|uniref:hypothetical protein n=1 Tax=Streptomyces sp. NPDC085927 TaxID=3365738 RepID=UPI0037D20D6B